jgi:hypothetical protein
VVENYLTTFGGCLPNLVLAISAAQFLGYIENSISCLMAARLYYESEWLKIYWVII